MSANLVGAFTESYYEIDAVNFIVECLADFDAALRKRSA
jgi:hypothetical protein